MFLLIGFTAEIEYLEIISDLKEPVIRDGQRHFIELDLLNII